MATTFTCVNEPAPDHHNLLLNDGGRERTLGNLRIKPQSKVFLKRSSHDTTLGLPKTKNIFNLNYRFLDSDHSSKHPITI